MSDSNTTVETATPNKPPITYEVPDAEGKPITKSVLDVIGEKDLWKVANNVTIISLLGIQKIANHENIVEKNFQTEVLPTKGNKQQHVVNIWVGFKGDSDPDNFTRGSGEASILNTGKIIIDSQGKRVYDEFSRIDSKYRYSMADKRAYCRAVSKLIKLFGVYSEVEAEEFSSKNAIKDNDY